jgi:type III secretion system low calcium response chaperone LcrH/SycD
MSKKSEKQAAWMDKATHDQFEKTMIDPMVEKLVEAQPPSKLESADQQRKRLRSQLWKTFEQYHQCFVHAGELLRQAKFKPEKLNSDMLQTIQAQSKENVKTMMEQGKTFRDILQLTDTDIVNIYEIACQQYSKENYKNSRDLFVFLSTVDPESAPLWSGLAMCEQRLGHYDMATQLYAVAAELNPFDPTQYLYAANCLHLQHREAEAIQILDAIIEAAQSAGTAEPEWVNLKAQATELKKEWQKVA